MWLWGDNPAAEVVTWAAGRGVSEIFVYVSPAVLTNGDLARLQEMKQRADALKIKLTRAGRRQFVGHEPRRPRSPGSGRWCVPGCSPASTWTSSRT